jgi:membrane protease subunit HflK
MAWNEPGGGQRDPWGRGTGGGKGPDLEAWLKRLRQRLGNFRGGGSVGGVGTIILALLLAWLLFDSWTVINASQVGVVTRFGAYDRTVPPGFHFVLPRPFENVRKVDMTSVRSVSDKMQMLTKDENIVQVDFNIQYQVNNAEHYLFSMQDPDEAVRQAAEAAVRRVVGASTMDTILSGEGAAMVAATQLSLQQLLNSYNTGITITEVNFQNISPPAEVKAAFDDVNRAREDKQRIEDEAKAYASKILPEARGNVARIVANAQAYEATREARAQGDSQRFLAMLKEYRAAPAVTRKRLWLETIEQVMAANTKVVDEGTGRNLIYLPLPHSAASTSTSAPATPTALLPGVGAELQTPAASSSSAAAQTAVPVTSAASTQGGQS